MVEPYFYFSKETGLCLVAQRSLIKCLLWRGDAVVGSGCGQLLIALLVAASIIPSEFCVCGLGMWTAGNTQTFLGIRPQVNLRLSRWKKKRVVLPGSEEGLVESPQMSP